MEYKNTLNYKNNNPIAFFDSGVGGLTVFQKVKKILPQENYLYFGDTKNMPYGEKSEEQLIEFAKIDLGIACVIREFVQAELNSGELIEVSLEESIPKRDVGFLYHNSTLKDNPAVEGFITYIKERIL